MTRRTGERAASPPRSTRGSAWALLALAVLSLALGFMLSRRDPAEPAAKSATSARADARPSPAASVAVPRRAPPAGAQPAARLSGRVVSASKAAIAGANVCLLPADEACCAPEQCVLSSALGRFSFRQVPAGRGSLLASAPGYRAQRLPLPEPAGGSALDGIELVLEAGGAEVSGTVLDALGGGVGGALVSARAGAARTLVATSLSHADGRFTLMTPPGALELQADAVAYSTAIRTAHAPARGVELVVALQSLIGGHVLEASTNAPLAGVEVAAIERGGSMRPPHRVSSDAEGRFELGGLAAGTYELVATAPSWRGRRELVRLGVGEALDAVEILADPATVLTARLELDDEPCPAGAVEVIGPVSRRGSIVADGTVELDGLVPGRYVVSYNCAPEAPAGQQPVSVGGEESLQIGSEPSARVWQLARAPAPERDGAGDVLVVIRGDDAADMRAILVGESGSAPLRGQPSGRGVLFANVPLGRYTAYLERAPGVHAGVELVRAGQSVDVTLTAPSARAISGRVLDGDGQPAPDVWVRAYNAEYPSLELAAAGSPALTDPHGAFELDGLFAQTYELTADGPGASARLEGVAGGARDVTLTLAAPRAESAGQPPPGAERPGRAPLPSPPR